MKPLFPTIVGLICVIRTLLRLLIIIIRSKRTSSFNSAKSILCSYPFSTKLAAYFWEKKNISIKHHDQNKKKNKLPFKPPLSVISLYYFLTKCPANKLAIHNCDREVEFQITKKQLQPLVKFLHEPEPYMNLLFASSMRSRNGHAAFSEATMSYAFFFCLLPDVQEGLGWFSKHKR